MTKNSLFLLVQKVLLTKWDPIGIGNLEEAVNEYDAYIGHILEIIESKNLEKEDVLFDYLVWAESERMELTPDEKHVKAVCKELLSLPGFSS